ncbi:MAG: hypothetical protein Q8R36_01860 [bacterium]|nr:hypothetical protein [bacterium]
MQNNNSKLKIFLILRRYCFSLCAFRFKFKGGFGLIEALVYVAIVGLLTVMVVNTALIMNTTSAKARLKRNILGEAGIAIERIVREIRLADSVVVAQSVFTTSPGTLKINTIIDANNNTPITKEFYLTDGKLMIKEGDGPARALTERVEITHLVFRHIIMGEISEAVVLEITAEDKVKKLTETQMFNTTAVLRRSY